MVQIDTEAFKKAWYSYEQIQKIIKSEKEFERNWITHSFNDVKKNTRAKLFSKAMVSV